MTLAAVLSWTLCLALTPLAATLAWRCDAVSRPDGRRKLQHRATPLWGGVSLYLAMAIALTAGHLLDVLPPGSLTICTALALSAGTLCLVGAYDDQHEISARRKLLGQIVATLPVVLAGIYAEQVTLLGCTFQLGWLGVVVTMAWLLLAINAVNLIDGMDGLAPTVGILTSATVAVVAGIYALPGVMLVALALAAALAAFLVYNRAPARVYLGDSGSMVVGGVLAVLVLRVATAEAAGGSLALVGALFFLPLLDTALAIVRRTLTGRNLAEADRGHVHHRLLDRGLGVWQVLGVLGGVCAISGVAAALVAATGTEFPAWILLPAVTAVAVYRKLLGHEEWGMLVHRITQGAAHPPSEPEAAGPRSGLRVVEPPPGRPPRHRPARVPTQSGASIPMEGSRSAA